MTSWVVLRNNWAAIKGHILMLETHDDLHYVPRKYKQKLEFVVFKGSFMGCTSTEYTCQLMIADDMREFRSRLKIMNRSAYLGHLFTMYARPSTCAMLSEWLVMDISELDELTYHTYFFDPPHVVVFDMDSTLITEEEEVQIRDVAIYESLEVLRKNNCVLCLWSYGDRQHVVHSLQKLELDKYFDVILAEGRKKGEYSTSKSVDTQYEVFYKNTPFYLNVDSECLPKSPRVVLWHLKEQGINFFKSITLVDDLLYNDYNYDNFVHLRRCPVPVEDWLEWHCAILSYIQNYDSEFELIKKK